MRDRNNALAASRKAERREYDQRRYALICSDSALSSKRKSQVRSNAMAYYYRNQDACVEKTKNWMRKNPEKRRAQKMRWSIKHREAILAKAKARYDPIKSSKASRAWYAANRKRAMERARLWQARNKDRITQYANTRRARKMSNGGTHTLDEWKALLASTGHTCVYCGRGEVKLTRDHVIPLARGGSDEIWNIVPACRPCNSAKARMTKEEFEVRKKLEASEAGLAAPLETSI